MTRLESSALRSPGGRGDTKAQPEARQAANTAAAAIDAMLAKLYAARSALVTEIRRSDDATAACGDALLARIRQDGTR